MMDNLQPQELPKKVKANGDNDLKFRASCDSSEQNKFRMPVMGSAPMAESGIKDAGGPTEYFTE